MAQNDDITRMLSNVEAGEDGAMDALMDAVYDDLRRVAERHMAQQFGMGLPGVTMEPAALVNESYMRLIRQRKAYGNRGQFFAIATKIMLRVLMDYHRSRKAAKRGGGKRPITLSLEGPAARPGTPEADKGIDLEIFTDAIDRLEALDSRKANVVKLRVVWGLDMKEIAEALSVSLATTERDWAFAKAWLAKEAAADVERAEGGVP